MSLYRQYELLSKMSAICDVAARKPHVNGMGNAGNAWRFTGIFRIMFQTVSSSCSMIKSKHSPRLVKWLQQKKKKRLLIIGNMSGNKIQYARDRSDYPKVKEERRKGVMDSTQQGGIHRKSAQSFRRSSAANTQKI